MLPGEPGRDELAAQVRQAAYKLIPRTDRPEDLADLADFVLAQGDPAMAAKAYLRLANLDRKQQHRLAGEGAPAGPRPRASPGAAARLYAQARACPAATTAVGLRLARQALRALRAANEGQAGHGAGQAARRAVPRTIWTCWSRPSTWRWRPAICSRPGAGPSSGCQLAGGSEQALREQMDILTKAGDPEGALRVAKQLLAQVARRLRAAPAGGPAGPLVGAGRGVAGALGLAGPPGLGGRPAEGAGAGPGAGRHRPRGRDVELRMKQARRMAAPTVPEFEALRKAAKPKPAPGRAAPGRAGGDAATHDVRWARSARYGERAVRPMPRAPVAGDARTRMPAPATTPAPAPAPRRPNKAQAGDAGVPAGRADRAGRRPGGQGAARAGDQGDGLVPLQLQGQPRLLEPAGPPVRAGRRAGAGAGLPRAAGPPEGDVPGRRHPPGRSCCGGCSGRRPP